MRTSLSATVFFLFIRLFQTKRLTGGDGTGIMVMLEPKGPCGGVVDEGTVGGEDQPTVILNVGEDLLVGGVPDLLLSASHEVNKLFDHVPVVIVVKLVGVSPEIEEAGGESEVSLHEFLCQLHQSRTVVMAGGGKAEPVLGKVEILGAYRSSRIEDPTGAEGFQQKLRRCVFVFPRSRADTCTCFLFIL